MSPLLKGFVSVIDFQCRIKKSRPSVKGTFGITEQKQELLGGEGPMTHASICDMQTGKQHLFCLCIKLALFPCLDWLYLDKGQPIP